jgi:(p)ppGpp synthase/HD superfamily hydrolase
MSSRTYSELVIAFRLGPGKSAENLPPASTPRQNIPCLEQKKSMISTPKLKKAIRFATKTHEVYQKQKRKGKDIPYITHPLAVGRILACAHFTLRIVISVEFLQCCE